MLRRRKMNAENEANADTALLSEKQSDVRKNGSKRVLTYYKKPIGARFAAFALRLILFAFIIYISIPFLFRFSPTFRRSLIFMNYINLQPFHNLSQPEMHYGLNCTQPFFIHANDVKLGAWHIFPKQRIHECANESRLAAEDFNDDRPVFLYFHGNGGTRGGRHRVGLYKVLAYSSLNAHVIAIDYRGYGDSSNVSPSADGLELDANAIYSWLSSKINVSRINVWGHSLGTAIAVRLAGKLLKESSPNSVILDAPFTNVAEAAFSYHLAVVYRWWPYFCWFFSEPLEQTAETAFDSLKLVGNIKSPLLILHSMDDITVPICLGQKLYQKALNASNSEVKMVVFREELNYGHKYIFKDKELPKIIEEFISKTN
ncbi:Monoacylglycerol lipase ABHD12-like protein [Dinothrombium tinctorium]|uniref:Monoacylglycerol lipase ABHD12-like protein n=1 Tax=Dinothrombium tinctorium TaxID=1965070 RepID=A0A443RPH7_9ACAR|nr:Monoacylglycerol lipase ABHD12-like protein [Dinothrombium tinctorium]